MIGFGHSWQDVECGLICVIRHLPFNAMSVKGDTSVGFISESVPANIAQLKIMNFQLLIFLFCLEVKAL